MSSFKKHPDEYLGDNCIQNVRFRSLIVGYTVEKLDLRRRACGAVKRDFDSISGDIPP